MVLKIKKNKLYLKTVFCQATKNGSRSFQILSVFDVARLVHILFRAGYARQTIDNVDSCICMDKLIDLVAGGGQHDSSVSFSSNHSTVTR